MSVEEALAVLRDPGAQLTRSALAELSDLAGDDLAAFRRAWADAADEDRVTAVAYFAEMAEDNVELDFNALFRVALDDDHDDVRLGAVAGLWECEERTLIGPLLSALRGDPSEPVRAAAAQALGRFAFMAEIGRLSERDGDRIGGTLVEAIDDEIESIEVRRRAIESLASMRHPRVPGLIEEAYENEDNKVQASALYAMGRTCDVAWMPTLIGELENEDPELRYESAAALGELGHDDAVEFLLPLVGDPDPQVQAAAIQSLGRIGGVAAKNALRRARREADARVGELIAGALEIAEFDDDPLSVDLLNRDSPASRN